MLYVYYSNEEYEVGKHKILTTYSERSVGSKPEVTSSALTNYSVLEIDERYNPNWAEVYSYVTTDVPDEIYIDRFYVNGGGQIVRTDTDEVVTINPNPQKESYKLSQLYGLTQQQLENYIDNNVTNLAEAKTFIKKLSAVVLWLVKQSKLNED